MAQLDTRIPLQVPNVLAQGAQVAQTNALRQQALGRGFDAIQDGMAAPLRRNVLAQQGQSMNLDNTAQEQAMLGNVLEKVAQAPDTWGQARDFLVQNGVFEQGDLPDQLTPETFQELSVIAFTPPDELEQYTLTPGSARFDRYGRKIASVPAAQKPGENYVNVSGVGLVDVSTPGGPSVAVAQPEKKGAVNEFVDESGQVWDLNTGQIIPGVKAPKGDKGPDLTAQAGLRKEWMANNKDFKAIRDSYVKVQGAASNPSPAGDLALIFNYMKMLDPGSVVREGEFATAQNAGGVDTQVRNMYNQVIDGTRLSESQRRDFVGVSQKIYGDQQNIYTQDLERYRGIASAGGLDPMATIPDITLAPPPQATPTIRTLADGSRWERQDDGTYLEIIE